MPLSIHSNYTITTYIQELDQGLVQHLSKCNTVGKRFNAFGSWADGQAIGWRVEATAAAAYTPASISYPNGVGKVFYPLTSLESSTLVWYVEM